MFWLRRPPYLRWLAAFLIMLCGLAWELQPASTVRYPFVAEQVAIGQDIGEVRWRDVPADLFPRWDHPISGVAVTNLPPGTPLLPSLLSDQSIPPGWWAVSLPLPDPVTPGTPVRITAGGRSADGVAVAEITDNGFEQTGTVAFPPDVADQVAEMATDSALVVMIGSPRAAQAADG